MTDLTDEELSKAEVMLESLCECRPLDLGRESHSHDCDIAYQSTHTAGLLAAMQRMAVELRRRRAADLIDTDRFALGACRDSASARIAEFASIIERVGLDRTYSQADYARDGKAKLEHAIAVLDRLIGAK